MLVPVDGPGLMEMAGDLQGGQAMKQNPDDSRDLTSGAGAQQTGVLGLDDELADGGHGVVSSLLQPGIRFGDRGVPENQLIVVRVLDGVVDIGPTAGAQPSDLGALMALRAVTNPLRDLS